MAKKVTALDIDDVLSTNATHFVEWSNKTWGTHLGVEDFDEDLATMWNVDIDTVRIRMNEYVKSDTVSGHGYFAEAIPVIKKLRSKYDFILVTSRRTLLAPLTRKWIDKNFPDLFETIHHTGIFDKTEKGGHKKTKADICKEIGADYLIDDQPKHCFAVAEAGIQTLLFGDYAWNRRLTELPPRVTRVKNWAER